LDPRVIDLPILAAPILLVHVGEDILMLLLKVSGMTCGHCVAAVTRAVKAVSSVDRVAVDLDRGEVSVEGHPNERAVREAIAEAGYNVDGMPRPAN
jgi:copper chaperone